MRYSQNNEEDIILKYFGDFKGHLLDIGANDGVTLSNSRKLMETGWTGDFVEPSDKPFVKLSTLYPNCHKVAISTENGLTNLYDSDSHLSSDESGLLSTIKQAETNAGSIIISKRFRLKWWILKHYWSLQALKCLIL